MSNNAVLDEQDRSLGNKAFLTHIVSFPRRKGTVLSLNNTALGQVLYF